MKLITLMSLLVLVPTIVLSDTIQTSQKCFPMNEIISISAEYQEGVVFISRNLLASNKSTVILLRNITSGTWTLIESDGTVGCVLGMGVEKSLVL